MFLMFFISICFLLLCFVWCLAGPFAVGLALNFCFNSFLSLKSGYTLARFLLVVPIDYVNVI